MGLVIDDPAATPAPDTANSSAHGGSTSFRRRPLAARWRGSAAALVVVSMAELMVVVMLLRSGVELGGAPSLAIFRRAVFWMCVPPTHTVLLRRLRAGTRELRAGEE
jgi:hypothetical protein